MTSQEENQRNIERRLSSIETKQDHMNKTVDRLMPLMERVVRLEERQGVLDLLPSAVQKNQTEGAVQHAIQDEKEKAREELRANIGTIVAIAGFIGSVVTLIGSIIVPLMLGSGQ